jgi:hypothetical protein
VASALCSGCEGRKRPTCGDVSIAEKADVNHHGHLCEMHSPYHDRITSVSGRRKRALRAPKCIEGSNDELVPVVGFGIHDRRIANPIPQLPHQDTGLRSQAWLLSRGE